MNSKKVKVLLGMGNYIPSNLDIAKFSNHNTSVFFTKLLNLDEDANGWILATVDFMQSATQLGKKAQQNAIARLRDLGLIERVETRTKETLRYIKLADNFADVMYEMTISDAVFNDENDDNDNSTLDPKEPTRKPLSVQRVGTFQSNALAPKEPSYIIERKREINREKKKETSGVKPHLLLDSFGAEGEAQQQAETLVNLKAQFEEARRLYPKRNTVRGFEKEWSEFIRAVKNWREVVPLLKPAIEARLTREAAERAADPKAFIPAFPDFSRYLKKGYYETEADADTRPTWQNGILALETFEQRVTAMKTLLRTGVITQDQYSDLFKEIRN